MEEPNDECQVLPGLSPGGSQLVSPLEAGIHELQTDRTNGAQVLATNAIHALRNVVTSIGSTEGFPSWNQIRLAGYRLSTSRPSMGSAITSTIIQTLNSIKDIWTEELGSDWQSPSLCSPNRLHKVRNLTTKRLDEVIHNRLQSSKLLGQHFEKYVRQNFAHTERPIRILTLSSSSSLRQCVYQAITEIKALQFELRILESRPRCEGASFAARLLRDLQSGLDEGIQSASKTSSKKECLLPNVKLLVAPDSHVCKLVEDVDIVFLGADRISVAGDVSNKMGSFAAALCAKQLSPFVKVIIASESDKIAKPGSMSAHEAENNGPEEVMAGWDQDTQSEVGAFNSSHLAVENIYFEWVPASYVDTYITEQGVLDVSQIQDISAQKERLERELFDDEIMSLAQQV
jgi:translation initiation factor 2B subunit (eIF-2B alpha/beta/delta family)